MENGHTIPSLESLEKFAHALQIPLYQLFYEGEKALFSLRVSNEKRGTR